MLKKMLILFFFPLVICSGCSSDKEGEQEEQEEQEEIKLNVDNIILSEETENSATVTFTTTQAWYIDKSDMKPTPGVSSSFANFWFTVTPMGGGPGTNTITVHLNSGFIERDSIGYIIIYCGSEQAVITVTHLINKVLYLESKKQIIDAKEGIVSIKVNHNIDYIVEIEQQAKSWISQIHTKTTTKDELSFAIAENTLFEDREGKIIIKNETKKMSDTLKVTQYGKSGDMGDGVYHIRVAGTLDKILSQIQLDTITTLKLHGNINVDDFKVMRDQMPKLTNLDINQVKLDAIPNMAFAGKYTLKKIIFPETITSIGSYAFRTSPPHYALGLEGSLILPDNINTIGDFAFGEQLRLTGSLIIPKNVINIGSSAFYECSGFTKLSLGNRLNTIGSSAFRGCKNLIGPLIMPKNVTNIGEYAFRDCDNLKEIHLSWEEPITYTTCMFPPKITLHVPKASIDLYKFYYGGEDRTIVGY